MNNIGPIDPCSDPAAVIHAVKTAKFGTEKCITSVVLLTTNCKQDGHGIHTSTCVLNHTGNIPPREARALCRRLRSLADELEARYDKEEGN